MAQRGVVDIVHRVRLVVADRRRALRLQPGEHGERERAAVVEHAVAPGPLVAAHHGGEAVDEHERGRTLETCVEQRRDAFMIGGVDVRYPRGARVHAQAEVGGNGCAVGHLGHCVGARGIAVAVDHQARIVLAHDGGVQQCAKFQPQFARADVPADVPRALGCGDAQIAERAWNGLTRVIDDDHERARTLGIVDLYRGWLVRFQPPLVHRPPPAKFRQAIYALSAACLHLAHATHGTPRAWGRKHRVAPRQEEGPPMIVRSGYKISYNCAGPTPMILMLNVRPELRARLTTPELMTTDRGVAIHEYRDAYGNSCSRLLAPPGPITIGADFLMEVSDHKDPDIKGLRQHAVQDLPDDTLVFLLGSRYIETSKLSQMAWNQFGHTPEGGQRVQAILDYAHSRIEFGYPHAHAERTAASGHEDRQGVCRDYAHLAVALCRCMNIPARYCTGYLGDIQVFVPDFPMDFSAWFEVYLDGAWRTCDARHNVPRVGRVLQCYGRDAADVAIATTFGWADLTGFEVIAEEA